MRIHRLDRLADALLGQYQRRLSPHKGFACPSGLLHGDTTCSAAFRRIIAQQGLVAGRAAMLHQLQRCQAASRTLHQAADPRAQVFCCILPIPL